VSSREILAAELRTTGTPVTRKSLQDLGQHVQETRGRLWMTEQFLAVAQTGPTVIDAVRHVCSDEFLLEMLGDRYQRIHVDAPEDLRRARFTIRETPIRRPTILQARTLWTGPGRLEADGEDPH